VLVIAFGCEDSGVPRGWSARVGTPGVNWIADFSGRTVARVASLVAAAKHDRDIVVASIHWGANWGYDIPHDHRRFAHQLIEQAGVDLVCGHSSHHVKGIAAERFCMAAAISSTTTRALAAPRRRTERISP
jgi:poly-gamma-glutamate synthesis protein (capsule biosynthesis protein)